MSISRRLEGRHISVVLPVSISRTARRKALLATGIEPNASQTFVVGDLTELPDDLRGRTLDVWEKVNIGVEEAERSAGFDTYLEIVGGRCNGYLALQRDGTHSWTRYADDGDGNSTDVDDVFYATPKRSVTALEYLAATIDAEQKDALHAMLDGAPLVSELGDDGELLIEDVLTAYERALDLAVHLIELVDAGTHNPESWIREPFEVTADAIFLNPDLRQDPPNRPAAILKQSSPAAYEQARELLEQLGQVPEQIVVEKIDGVCSHWWSSICAQFVDERKVRVLLKIAVTNALNEARLEQEKQKVAQSYERTRQGWIAKHGSERLRRAAGRGYRHDGIYRDERLQLELPNFVGSLGRKPSVRELVNPSEQALEVEAQVLARAEALGISEDKVRLVFVQTGQDSDWSDGEFVQIEGYLGRHTVWQSISGERTDDDIPF